MTTAAQTLETEVVVLLPVADCHKSPSQPRRRGADKLDEDFVASIKRKGVLQPILVRVRKAGGWEIVFGHRRHSGCVAAKRETIPAIVRELSDDDVFEAQLIENVHREDMHPLDEADGFKRMVDRGKTAQHIAERVGRPVTYVAQRLKLCELGKEVRAALDKDEISMGVAVLLARVPAGLQAEALESVGDRWGEGQTSVAEAKRTLEADYLLRLDQAPFDILDQQLVPKAGACNACPKRSGNQRELFPDVARADLCTDRVCYRGKLDAVWQIRKKAAATGGAPVLEGKEAQRALTHYNSGYKKLDADEYVGDKLKKVRSLFGKDLPPITLARGDNGEIVELVKAADVAKVVKQKAPARSSTEDSYRAQTRRQMERDRRRALVIDRVIATAVENGGRLSEAQLLRPLVHALAERTWNDGQAAIIRRRGIEMKKTRFGGIGAEETLVAYLKTLKESDQVAGLGLELALRTFAPGRYAHAKAVWAETLKALGVNHAAIERQVAAEAKAKKKTKTKVK